MTAIQPELMTRLNQVAHAIDDVLLADLTLRHALKAGHVPFDAPIPEAVARYGDGPLFGLWLMCSRVEALRLAWTGKPGPVAIPAPDEPDEAPGLEPAAPSPADEGTENQPRLAGA